MTSTAGCFILDGGAIPVSSKAFPEGAGTGGFARCRSGKAILAARDAAKTVSSTAVANEELRVLDFGIGIAVATGISTALFFKALRGTGIGMVVDADWDVVADGSSSAGSATWTLDLPIGIRQPFQVPTFNWGLTATSNGVGEIGVGGTSSCISAPVLDPQPLNGPGLGSWAEIAVAGIGGGGVAIEPVPDAGRIIVWLHPKPEETVSRAIAPIPATWIARNRLVHDSQGSTVILRPPLPGNRFGCAFTDISLESAINHSTRYSMSRDLVAMLRGILYRPDRL